jgi:hypothetical protein
MRRLNNVGRRRLCANDSEVTSLDARPARFESATGGLEVPTVAF